jgi:hypothetical protein
MVTSIQAQAEIGLCRVTDTLQTRFHLAHALMVYKSDKLI